MRNSLTSKVFISNVRSKRFLDAHLYRCINATTVQYCIIPESRLKNGILEDAILHHSGCEKPDTRLKPLPTIRNV